MLKRPQKITFAEMRASGVRGLLICCSGNLYFRGRLFRHHHFRPIF